MGEALITEVTDAVAAVGTDIVAIGGAIILVAASVMAVRWVKAQFF